MAVQDTRIKLITLANGEYEIDAKYLLDSSGTEKSWADILDLVSVKLEVVAVDTLPTASASTLGKIYLIPSTSGEGTNIKDEYVTLKSSAEPYTYSWEQIGSSAIDLSNYLQKNTTYSNAALSNGAHIHDVSGTVTIPTISSTNTKVKASASGTSVTAASTASAITGFDKHSTDSVLGSKTSFAVGGTPSTTTVNSATASSVYASNTVFGSDTTASKVTVTNGTAATFTQGSKASWSADVDSNGILSFNFTANGTDKFTTNTPTAVSTSDVAVPVVSSNTSVEASKVSTSEVTVVNGMTGVTVTANSNDVVNPITALGTPTTASAITSIRVASEPTITLSSGDEGDIELVDTVTIGSTSASLTDGKAASNGAHAHDIKVTD